MSNHITVDVYPWWDWKNAPEDIPGKGLGGLWDITTMKEAGKWVN
jgi:hypothetical protein